jgi:hypothetical protein
MSPTFPRAAARLLTVAALALALTGCGDDGTTGTPAPSDSSSPSASATPVSVGIYYTVDTRTGFRLAREIRDLPGVDPGVEAVQAMIAGANDPDYSTTWNPDTQVLGVTEHGGTIDVDVSADARTANVGSEGAGLMVQQLVYTVTGALGSDDADVQLLVEGKPAGELWGTLVWDKPVARADPLDVRCLVQIDEPRDGATTSSPLRVVGEAAVFEAMLSWRVLDEKGAEVIAGNTMTAEGQTFAPFMFPVVLQPGTYTVEIKEDDPSGGEGGAPMTDTRTVTIE